MGKFENLTVAMQWLQNSMTVKTIQLYIFKRVNFKVHDMSSVLNNCNYCLKKEETGRRNLGEH